MVIFLGDSLTARGRWQNYFECGKIENFGIDGDTTRGILSRLEYVLRRKPTKIFLLIGINDLGGLDSADEVFKNYIKILEKLKSYNIEILTYQLIYTQMIPYNKKVKIFNELLVSYCKKHSIINIDLNNKFSKNEYLKDDYTTDGIHLNLIAYNIWADLIKKYI